jgi:hypothetical protein
MKTTLNQLVKISGVSRYHLLKIIADLEIEPEIEQSPLPPPQQTIIPPQIVKQKNEKKKETLTYLIILKKVKI